MKLIKTGLLFVVSGTLFLMAGCASEPVVEDAPSLVGSKWHYSDEQWRYDLEFAAGGVLKTTHPRDRTKDNDTWEQNGATVTFYFNNKFSQHSGTLSGANSMTGTATNKKGSEWKWKATRAD